MAVLAAFPILSGLLILQSAIASQIPLIRGTSDLVMLAILAWALQKPVQTAWHWSIIGGLMVSLVSALPFGVALSGYLLATWVALILRKRVWQVPILAMFVTTFIGTVITHFLSLAAMQAVGSPLPWLDAVNLITLPSILVNLVLAIPLFALLGDLAKWLYPEELAV